MDDLRKKLLYRATHRGMKETDRLIGGFAVAHLAELTAAQLAPFEALLDHNDNDLLDWLLGRQPLPEGQDRALIELIIKFKEGL